MWPDFVAWQAFIALFFVMAAEKYSELIGQMLGYKEKRELVKIVRLLMS